MPRLAGRSISRENPPERCGTDLRGSSCTGYRTKQSTIEPPAEEIQRFNRFWDSLLLTRHRSDLPTEAPTILAEPLPRSLSLVRVETLDGVSVAARAISLLRGWAAFGLMTAS
jgi:hypothetical protein